jgi:hypothetical protein
VFEHGRGSLLLYAYDPSTVLARLSIIFCFFARLFSTFSRTLVLGATQIVNVLQTLPARWYPADMDVREMARLGGIARAKSMTAEERRKSAMKAAKAAALVHKKRAKAKNAAQKKESPS